MLVTFPCSRNIQILLLCSFFYTLCDFVQADPPFPLCSNSTVSADNIFFPKNLDNLLSSLSSNASISNLYNTTTGNDQETLYGLSFCYQYLHTDQCEKCISLATQDIQRRCANNREAVIFEDHCQLRYSNKSFLRHLDTTGNIWKDNTQNVTEPDRYKTLVNGLLHDISRRAAWDPSAGMYASRDLNFTETETIYAFVQCTSDLSPYDCNTCLETAIKNTSRCCSESRGARLYSRSCYLRYEFYAFYRGESGPNSLQIDYKSAKGAQKENWIIAAFTIGSSILVVALVAAGVYCLATRSRTKPKEGPVAGGDFQNLQPTENLNSLRVPFINLATLIVATKNFSDFNKLGQGGFGPVYKGQLPDGKEVAVKRLLCDSEQGVEEFTNEVLFILKLQHKNLVKLFGFCVDGEEKLLIYEYMPNGSLDTFLFDPNKRAQLHWHRRLSIINGIARGMLYLHEDSRLRIIHRDLKPSNILLDSEMTPKISDFGMARIFGGSNGEANTAKIVGTYGYMAPEYAMEGLYSIKSDVFGFGVLLLEIVTGKRNAGFHLSKLAPNLLTYAWQLWNEGKGLELIDPLLRDSCDLCEFLRYMQIGLLCVQEDAYDRPTMSTVVVMLKGEVVILSQPERPGFSMGRFVDYYETNDIYYSANGLTTSGTLLS